MAPKNTEKIMNNIQNERNGKRYLCIYHNLNFENMFAKYSQTLVKN